MEYLLSLSILNIHLFDAGLPSNSSAIANPFAKDRAKASNNHMIPSHAALPMAKEILETYYALKMPELVTLARAASNFRSTSESFVIAQVPTVKD